MNLSNIYKIISGLSIGLLSFHTAAQAQYSNTPLESEVAQLASRGDYASIEKLIEKQERLWKTAPSVSYFRDMRSIGSVLTGSSNAQIYWLGRKVIWDVVLKPAPNEYGAAQAVRLWKEELFFLDAEDLSPYALSVSREMFASIRHDTFLMLAEYARQANATIIPGYHNRPASLADRDKQNRIDNQVQDQARSAIRWLAEGQDNYLIEAYRRNPRDDQELKQLLDILNIQGAHRDKILERVAQDVVLPPGMPPNLRKIYEDR